MGTSKRKVIITCAVTGAIHTPSMSKYLPVTPKEIADAAIAASEAGAAILHLHARDPESGCTTQDSKVFEQFLPEIKQATNAVVNITTGGSPHMTVEERMQPAATSKAIKLWRRGCLHTLRRRSLLSLFVVLFLLVIYIYICMHTYIYVCMR